MDPSHQATWRAAWTCSLCGLAFGASTLTAHEASSAFLTAGRLHPAALGVVAVLGTPGIGAALLCAAAGLAVLSASAGLAMGSRSTTPGPAVALAAAGAGLLAGTALQVALTGGTSGRLASAAALLASVYVVASQRDGAAAECLKYVDARQLTVTLAVEFLARFAAVFLGMAQGAHAEKWNGTSWTTGLRMMAAALWLFFLALRVSTARGLWTTLGHVPRYAAVNFLSWACPACALLAGFLAGVGGVSAASPETKAELVLMLGSALCLAALSAALLGAALGAVATVGRGGLEVAAGGAMMSLVALRMVVPAWQAMGAGAGLGCLLGASAAAGMSLAIASCASLQHACVAPVCCAFGALLGSGGFGSLTVLITVAVMAAFPYWQAAVVLPTDLLLLEHYRDTSVDGAVLAGLLLGVAAAGAAVLGGAALATATMGTLGTLGVLLAAAVSLGVTLAEILKTLQGEPMEIVGSLMVLLALLSGTDMTYFIQFRP